jgi:hypothetical protein
MPQLPGARAIIPAMPSLTALQMSSDADFDMVAITSAANGVEMMRPVIPALAQVSCCNSKSPIS